MDIATLVQQLEGLVKQIENNPTVGMRVAAITAMDDHEVRFLGYGEYKGQEKPPHVEEMSFEEAEAALPRDAAGNYPKGMETTEMRRAKFEEWKKGDLYKSMYLIHKILLDDGEVVWGNECHFTPAEKFKSTIKDRRIQWVVFARKPDGTVSHEIEAGTA